MTPLDFDQNEFEDANNEDQLDRLLQESNWIPPNPDAIARLEAHWRERLRQNTVKPARLPRFRPWRYAAAAAVLISATLSSWWLVGLSGDRDEPLATKPPIVREAEDKNLDAPSKTDLAQEVDQEVENPSRWSRPPTAYERLVFAASQKPVVAQEPSTSDPVLTAALDKAADATDFELAQLAQPLRSDAFRFERLLLREAQSATSTRQLAAVRLLTHLGTGYSAPLLVELSRVPHVRAASVDALQNILPPESLGRLALNESDPKTQLALCRALLKTGSHKSVTVYLQLLGYPPTSETALIALDTVDYPPIDLLFDFLVGENGHQRQLAARALAQINGPETAHRLLDTAMKSEHPQESLLALMLCRGSEAARLVVVAQQTIPLRGAFNGALMQRQLLTP